MKKIKDKIYLGKGSDVDRAFNFHDCYVRDGTLTGIWTNDGKLTAVIRPITGGGFLSERAFRREIDPREKVIFDRENVGNFNYPKVAELYKRDFAILEEHFFYSQS